MVDAASTVVGAQRSIRLNALLSRVTILEFQRLKQQVTQLEGCSPLHADNALVFSPVTWLQSVCILNNRMINRSIRCTAGARVQ